MLLEVRLTRYNLQSRRLVNIFVNYAILINENVEKKRNTQVPTSICTARTDLALEIARISDYRKNVSPGIVQRKYPHCYIYIFSVYRSKSVYQFSMHTCTDCIYHRSGGAKCMIDLYIRHPLTLCWKCKSTILA